MTEGLRAGVAESPTSAGAAGTAPVDAVARPQLSRPERLDQILVGAGGESEHDVRLLPERGQHDDERRAEQPDPACGLEAVDAGEVDVERGDDRAVLGDGGDPVETGCGQDRAESCSPEDLLQQRADVRIVFDDDSGLRGVFGHALPCGSGREHHTGMRVTVPILGEHSARILGERGETTDPDVLSGVRRERS